MKRGIFIIMGVSGCGKSTVGKLLAKELGIPFFDGDDYHPDSNIQKMSDGKALNDKDRHGWLIRLNKLAKENNRDGCIIACSALKEKYRTTIGEGIESEIRFIYLKGDLATIQKRMENRKEHYMPVSLLESQFEILEEPKDALVLSIEEPAELLVGKIKETL